MIQENPQEWMKEFVAYAKTRGFIYPGSELYGGLANTWDYGPLGVELKMKLKEMWWNFFIRARQDMVGLDSAILMNPKVWEASGHVGQFSDPLVDCKNCHNRYRADSFLKENLCIDTDGFSLEELNQLFLDNQSKLQCPHCKSSNFTEVRQFQLMFQTHQGVTKESSSLIYLRPETAQGIFVQFKNILNSSRKKIPFGVGQIGKSFRNEITPGNFIFRMREFEQMEIEYFIHPSEKEKYYQLWIELSLNFFTQELGIDKEFLQKREHLSKELAHYSDATCDIEFQYPFGWGELSGVASRGNYDLNTHQQASGEDLTYLDVKNNERYLPSVIEPSFGVDRAFFALLVNAYKKEVLEDGSERIVLKLKPLLAPIFVAILPLKKNETRIVELGHQIMESLKPYYKVLYDDTGSIGKLYRRQDEIGTPFCITVDFDSLEDQTVTVRNRDTMKQDRVHKKDLKNYFEMYLNRGGFKDEN